MDHGMLLGVKIKAVIPIEYWEVLMVNVILVSMPADIVSDVMENIRETYDGHVTFNSMNPSWSETSDKGKDVEINKNILEDILDYDVVYGVFPPAAREALVGMSRLTFNSPITNGGKFLRWMKF